MSDFDISSEAVVDTAKIHLKNARGVHMYADGKPVRIIVLGPSSKEFGVIENRQTNRALKRAKDNDGQATPASPEDRWQDDAEDLAALTVGFENFNYPAANGKAGTALFEALYNDRALGFIRKQVSLFVQDWANFAPGSAAS